MHYLVTAEPTAQALMRVLNFFAQLDVLPCEVTSRRAGEEMEVSVRVSGLTDHGARVIAEKMRSSLLVRNVDLNGVSDHAKELN